MNAPAKAPRVRRPVVDRPRPAPKASAEAKIKAVATSPWWHKIKTHAADGSAIDFGQGGWNMKQSGLTTIGVVRVSDGEWVLPPVKCKEYLQEVMYAKHVGKDMYAYGYTALADKISGQKLALVLGVPQEMDFVGPCKWALDRGAKLFQVLTNNTFDTPMITVTGRTFKTKAWKVGTHPYEQDMLVVEYDERIENHPALFALFAMCLRAGSMYNIGPKHPASVYAQIITDATYWWARNFTLEPPGMGDHTHLKDNLLQVVNHAALLTRQVLDYPADKVYAFLSRLMSGTAWHTGSGIMGFTEQKLYKEKAK